MRSLKDRYTDIIERSKRIDASAPESEILEIRKEIENLDYELRHTGMEPSQRRELLTLSGAATAILARQVDAARNPLVISPEPQSRPASPTRSDSPARSGNAFSEAALRNRRDRGIER
ncbi:hypothetical protein [Nocardia sp. NPDC127526]|uniref:hypothetical protein n=1 Tax=Nocardia sp. NPDC127526 TaxID=3345393 RepID=UPI0036266202